MGEIRGTKRPEPVEMQVEMQDVFFGRLRPFSDIAFSNEHKRLARLDYSSDAQLCGQQIAFLVFYRENGGRWARFKREANGHIYAVDSADVVIVSEEWFEEVSPTVAMVKG